MHSFLFHKLHVIFSIDPVKPYSGVVLAWKLEHGAHTLLPSHTFPPTSTTDLRSSLTAFPLALEPLLGRTARRKKAQSTQQRGGGPGGGHASPASMECPEMHQAGQGFLSDGPQASMGAQRRCLLCSPQRGSRSGLLHAGVASGERLYWGIPLAIGRKANTFIGWGH